MAATKAQTPRLAPWHDVLKRLKAPWFGRDIHLRLLDTEECLLWLGFVSDPPDPVLPSDLGRTSEAIHLFTLLARVDFDAWVRETLTIWPQSVARGWVEFNLKPVALERPLRLGLKVEVATANQVDELFCLHTHNNRADVNPSQAFLQVREELLRKCDEPPGEQEDETEWQIPVCVEHTFFRRDFDIIVGMLKSTVEAVKVMQSASIFALEGGSDQGPRAHRPRFTISEIEAGSPGTAIHTKESFSLLVEIAKLGARIGSMGGFYMRNPRPRHHEDMLAMVQGLRYLTAHDGDIGAMRTCSRSVCVSYHHSRDVMLGLLSAIAASKSVRQVEIDLYEDPYLDGDSDVEDEEEDRGGDWEWITYHLFSRFASHNIHTLQLNLLNLKTTEVDAIRDLLPERNPLATLDGRHDESDQEGQQLVASRFCVVFPAEVQASLYEPDEFSNMVDKMIFTTPAPETVRVISKPVEGEGPWWLVVLPGLSFAWVHEDDIQSFVSTTTEEQTLERPAFPTITITQLTDDSREASVDLLKLIGHGTTRIEVAGGEVDENMDSWFGSVLRACPKLEELSLTLRTTASLTPFIDDAVAGFCRLRELELRPLYIEDPECASRFFATLCDPLHPLTMHLELLTLHFLIEQDNFSGVIDAAVKMLKHNRRLQCVDLGFYLPPGSISRKDEIERVFGGDLEAIVPIRVAPLDLVSKTAFLSVVDSKASGGGACDQLDSGVMSNIFQYAAVSRGRFFHLTFESSF